MTQRFHSWAFTQENKSISHDEMLSQCHSHFIYNSPKLETAHVSISR